MAVDSKKLTHMNEQDNEQKQTSKNKPSLSETTKEAIKAREKLATDDTHGRNDTARMEHLLYEYQKRQEQVLSSINKMVEEIRVIKKEISDIESFAQQLTLNGVSQAHKKAEKMTISHLNKAQEKYVTYVQTLVEQAQKRTERLKRSSRQSMFIPVTTWLMQLLIVGLLIYNFK
ncbi:hypothetical protein [Arcanobacterium hippocoleae]|uniref:Chromosome segregation ATPase n=1 Tax=Arcanobacterium hippocoleae TaxID=149017 RepID=A0ABU1T1I0_9ACTO|nr:hypothetical protein [Arcanobacterium hippocoleae]MDR6939231.1 chromosome segregation ATPase [Arcanobacterium hippocoleae]